MRASKLHLAIALAAGFAASGTVGAVPVKDVPNLASIIFYEATSGIVSASFVKASSQLTTKLADPLSSTNRDFIGATTEFYDVYYSDADGTFNLAGEYVTVSGQYAGSTGGGFNIREVRLIFADSSTEHANYVASYVALGAGSFPSTVPYAIDGDINTYTNLGETLDEPAGTRLRLTLGFLSSSGEPPNGAPEPTTLALLGLGLAGLAATRRRK